MNIWEVDGLSHWTILDFYATQCEESDDLTLRMVGLYLRDRADQYVKANQ